jgi:hypothetical protein
MGIVLPFKGRIRRLSELELSLMNSINDCPEIAQCGVRASPRPPRGIALTINGARIGVWYDWQGQLIFFPPQATAGVANVCSIDEARDATLLICLALAV